MFVCLVGLGTCLIIKDLVGFLRGIFLRTASARTDAALAAAAAAAAQAQPEALALRQAGEGANGLPEDDSEGEDDDDDEDDDDVDNVDDAAEAINPDQEIAAGLAMGIDLHLQRIAELRGARYAPRYTGGNWPKPLDIPEGVQRLAEDDKAR